ncbi:hypothetical protein pb186bvf_006563 [Paramecium bursaria]
MENQYSFVVFESNNHYIIKLLKIQILIQIQYSKTYGIPQFLKNFDAFSIPIQLKYKNKTQQIFIQNLISDTPCTSLAYAMMVLVQWKSGQILAKSQSQTQTTLERNLTLEDGFFQIGIFNQTFDPFTQTQNILLPLLIKLNNTNYEKPIPLFSKQVDSLYEQSEERSVVQLPSISLSHLTNSHKNNDYQIQYFLILTRCSQELINNIGTCASEEVIDSYIQNLPPILDLSINMQQFNPYTFKYDTVTKKQYLSFEKEWVTYSQIQFQVTKLSINDGFIFDSINENSIINDYSISNQIVTSKFAQQIMGYKTLCIFFLRLDSLSIQQQVVFPKLGEVLAQIGSVVQLLLMSKFLFQFINNYLYDFEIMDNIISIYYQEWKQIQVCRNLKGEIISVSSNNKQIDPEEYKLVRKKLSSEFSNKLDIMSIIYQLAKLQQCMIGINDNDKIEKILNQRINLNFKSFQNELLFSENRCQILPLDEDKEEMQKSQLTIEQQKSPTSINELKQEQEFFLLINSEDLDSSLYFNYQNCVFLKKQ